MTREQAFVEAFLRLHGENDPLREDRSCVIKVKHDDHHDDHTPCQCCNGTQNVRLRSCPPILLCDACWYDPALRFDECKHGVVTAQP